MQKFSVDLCCTKGVHKKNTAQRCFAALTYLFPFPLPCLARRSWGVFWVLHCTLRVTFKPCSGCIAAEWQTANTFLYGFLAWNSLKASGFSLFRERKHRVIQDWATFPTIYQWSSFCERQSSASLQAARVSFSEYGSFWCLSVFLELYVWI